MPNYGQSPSTNITVNSGGSKLDKAAGLLGNAKEKKSSAASKLLATAATATGVNEASMLMGNENFLDAINKGVSSLSNGAIDASKALGNLSPEQTEALKSAASNVSGALGDAAEAFKNSPFGKIHFMRDLGGAFVGATDEGRLINSKATEWVNKGLNLESGTPSYIEEVGGLGLGGLAAYGLFKGGKALLNRKMYKADREVEHAHDLKLAKEVRDTGTENLFRLDKAKNLRG